MFVKAFKNAGHKVEGAVETAAVEAAFGLAAILLGCGAYLFAAVAAVFWLSSLMETPLALLLVAGATAFAAFAIYIVGIRSLAPPKASEQPPSDAAASPFSVLFTSLGERGTPLDIAIKGLFVRQLKHSPVSTVAATVALGALAGMLMAEDDEEGAR